MGSLLCWSMHHPSHQRIEKRSQKKPVLFPYAENTWAKQINMAALKNAIVESFPAYVQEDEEEYADFPIGDRIFYTDGAGTDFYKFPGVDKP